MPTFTVPDEDSSLVSEGMGMDLEGDSFEQEVETFNNKSPETRVKELAAAWRAQEREKHIQLVREAEPAPIPGKKKYNLRPYIPHHLREPISIADFPMKNTEVPSSTGKRKRSESHPPARDTYHSEPDTIYEPTIRRIGGMFVTMYTIGMTVMTSLWSYVRGKYPAATPDEEQEITALETDSSGRKRRAIPTNSFRAPSASPQSQGSPWAQSSPSQVTVIPPMSAQKTDITTTPAPGAFPTAEKTFINSSSTHDGFSLEEKYDTNTTSTYGGFPSKERTSINTKSTHGDFRSEEKTNKKTSSAPGPFSSASLPSPDSMSPAEDYPKSTLGARYKSSVDTTPNFDSSVYTDGGAVESNKPSLREMRQRFNRSFNVATVDDFDSFTEEKEAAEEEARLNRVRAEVQASKDGKNAEKACEEEAFWKQEDLMRDDANNKAKFIAKKEKFNVEDGEHEQELMMLDLEHQLHHGKHTCEQNSCFVKYHEYDGLRAHEDAKIYAQEVARETEEYNTNHMTADESRAFRGTSAFRRAELGGKQQQVAKRRPIGSGAKAKSAAGAAAAAAEGKESEAGWTGAAKKDSKRPITPLAHRPASYKGGLEPSPQQSPPGANAQQPWSWNKTMMAGKSSIKGRSKADSKDEEIDALISRGKTAVVRSPEEQRVMSFMENRREVRHQIQQRRQEEKVVGRHNFLRNAALTTAIYERQLADVRNDWERARQEKEAEEEAARIAAVEALARKEAEEAELVHRAAQEAEEEAARLKAAEEEAAKLKAEEDALAAAAQDSEVKALREPDPEWIKKQQLVRPLDPYWDDRVKTAMATADRNTPLAQTLDGSAITRHDLGSLLPQEGTSDDKSGWLNDQIVNAMFTAIVQRKAEQTHFVKGQVPAFETYHSGWYTTYKKSGANGLARWSRRKGIAGPKLLQAEKIFLPINQGGHWQLLVISPTARTIEFFCSLNFKPDKYFKCAREWLEMELGAKHYVASEWTESPLRSNKQANQDDCGVFTILNGLAAAKGHPHDDVRAGKMGEARRMVAAILLNEGVSGDWEL